MTPVSKRASTRANLLTGLFILFLSVALAADTSSAIDSQALSALPVKTRDLGPIIIGELETIRQEFRSADKGSWAQTIHHPGASFIKVHFLRLHLQPGDYVTVSDRERVEVYTYPDVSDYTTDGGEGFWAISVNGDTAVIELHSGNASQELAQAELQQFGAVIDKYVHGYAQPEILARMVSPESTCGNPDRRDVICYQSSHPTEFDRSRAVAGLLINGVSWCTAWRVGPNNHMFTNEHCITSQSDVNATEVWFNYQRLVCGSGGTGPITKVTGASLLVDDYTLDFSLFTINGFTSISGFRYLELDTRPPVANEEIYIPQQGGGEPKQFGIDSDQNTGNVCRIDVPAINGLGDNTYTGYLCDTISGSSGSPVLARSSHRVIALHHAGVASPWTCPLDGMNQGVRIDRIWPLVKSHLTTQDQPPVSDNAAFIADITIPDGTVVSPGQALVKTWRMKNIGRAWGSGYQLAFVNGNQMGAPNAVDVATTAPGQEVDIRVNLTAPTSNGDHTGYWRLRNPDGTYFGDQVWVQIRVQTASSYITTLSADPPSPSNSSSVRIHARVENFPNFRAMRLKIDGDVVYELGAPEFYYNWNTSGYAGGEHSIVVEVADQTDTSWSRPETKGMTYTLEGTTGSNNHAPNRPILVANPAYDWYVTIGSPPQLCAQEQGDPDGDAITQYRFVATASVGTADSGWVGGPCYTFGSLASGTYEWHTQVKDSQGGISDWSDTWHFTVEPTGVTASTDHFSPTSPSNAEEVKIYGCSSGHAGVNVTLRVLVNDANDGTDSGEWHIIKEQGSPCFNDIDVPIWRTLEYADGPHLVRVVAMAIQPDAGDVYDEVYTLNHRRPDSTRLAAPVPLSRDIREAIYLNSRTITFQWEPTIRAQSYTLHIGTNPSPEGDTNPVFRQTFASSVTEHTIAFSQDYPTLYWQVEATNDVGSNVSGDQLFGIDRLEPSCAVQSLSGTTYESVFQVNWNGSDSLAGVRTFDIQYMDSDRGTWEDWLAAIPSTKTYELFTGQPGHTYYYRCRATDNANNTGAYPPSADASTKIDPAARPPTPWWESAYSEKRNLIIQNNMPDVALPLDYPVHLQFDSNTTPTAAELYGASQSTPKCHDLRIVYNDATELDRVVQNCSSSAIDIWFRTQVAILGGSSDSAAHQLYYGNASAGAPPADSNKVWYPYRETDTTYLYFFQEGSGSIAHDSSGNGRDCSLDPSVQWAPSKFGIGLRFNRSNLGDSRSLNCGSAIPRSSFTIDFWYKPDPDDGGYITAELAGGGNGGGGNNWLLQNFEGRLRLDVWPCPPCGSSEVRSNFNLRDSQYVNKWNHLAVTFNGVNEVKFYINGNLDSTKYLNQSGINTYTPPLEIGSAEGIRQVKASLGAFRISNGVKTNFPYGAFAAITNEPATAAGAPITPPITGSPDLAVLSLATYPNPSGGVLVQAVVENQGDVDTQNGFYTDLYLDHLPTGSGDYTGSVRFWVNDPIAAGATATLTTVITNLSGLGGAASQSAAPASETSGTLYAQTDSLGAVAEPDEANNIYSAGTEICIATADSYEGDDAVEGASVITAGETQTHNFDRPGDLDWIKFDAQAGTTYVLRAYNLGPMSDTYLYLYDTDGIALLASNDDYGGSLASQIEWTASAAGTYYLLAQHWNPNAGGCGTMYDLTVGLDFAYDIFLPLIAR